MSMQEVHDLMSVDYRKYVADIIDRYPLQEQNRANYERFETQAQLGSMTRTVQLKGSRIEKGRVVLYTPNEEKGYVIVWWQGCMCPAVIKAHKVKPL